MVSIRIRCTPLMLAGVVLAFMPGQSLAQQRSRNLITREEIANSAQKDQDILQVIRNLRPHFLQRPRGIRTMGNSVIPPVAVYVDNVRESDAGALRMITAASVEEVRYLEPAQSEGEFGVSAAGGAVVVKRQRAVRAVAPVRDTTQSPPA